MKSLAGKTVRVKYDAAGNQWAAWFTDTPQVAFGADLPMNAVRRLLGGTEASLGDVQLHVDQDQAGSGVVLPVAWS